MKLVLEINYNTVCGIEARTVKSGWVSMVAEIYSLFLCSVELAQNGRAPDVESGGHVFERHI